MNPEATGRRQDQQDVLISELKKGWAGWDSKITQDIRKLLRISATHRKLSWIGDPHRPKVRPVSLTGPRSSQWTALANEWSVDLTDRRSDQCNVLVSE